MLDVCCPVSTGHVKGPFVPIVSIEFYMSGAALGGVILYWLILRNNVALQVLPLRLLPKGCLTIREGGIWSEDNQLTISSTIIKALSGLLQ